MTSKPTFAVGDAVTLKGQSQVLTVVPPVQNNAGQLVTRDGWVWCVHCTPAGTGFHLLPEVALVKKAGRRLK